MRLVFFTSLAFHLIVGVGPGTYRAHAQNTPKEPMKNSDSLVISKVEISIGAQLHMTTIYDFNSLQHLESFNILSIPTGDNYNTSSRFSLDAAQSRVNLDISYKSKKLGLITSYFEGDFFGSGPLNFRMRYFYVNVKSFRFGRDYSVFCDMDTWPDIVDFDGPPTGIWARSSQVRYTKQFNKSNKIAVAIESPSPEITPIMSIDSTINETFQGFPDLAAHWNLKGKQGHIQISLIYRKLYYKKGNKTLSNDAGGVAISGHINFRKKDKLILQATAGSGTASYMVSFMGGGYDAVTSSTGVLSNIPVHGGFAAYEFYYSNNLKSTFVYGRTQLTTDIKDLPKDSFRGYYYSANLFWILDDYITIGIEGEYGNVRNFHNERGNATRIQSMFLFHF